MCKKQKTVSEISYLNAINEFNDALKRVKILENNLPLVDSEFYGIAFEELQNARQLVDILLRKCKMLRNR